MKFNRPYCPAVLSQSGPFIAAGVLIPDPAVGLPVFGACAAAPAVPVSATTAASAVAITSATRVDRGADLRATRIPHPPGKPMLDTERRSVGSIAPVGSRARSAAGLDQLDRHAVEERRFEVREPQSL